MPRLDPRDMIAAEAAPEAAEAPPTSAAPPPAGLSEADLTRIAQVVASTLVAQQAAKPAPAGPSQADTPYRSGEQAQLAAPGEGRTPVTVLLQPRHRAYLEARALAHGETPERHLESILRQFQAHHDAWQASETAPSEPGQMAGTRRL